MFFKAFQAFSFVQNDLALKLCNIRNSSKTAPREALIPNPKARLREQVREVMRFHHYSFARRKPIGSGSNGSFCFTPAAPKEMRNGHNKTNPSKLCFPTMFYFAICLMGASTDSGPARLCPQVRRHKKVTNIKNGPTSFFRPKPGSRNVNRSDNIIKTTNEYQ